MTTRENVLDIDCYLAPRPGTYNKQMTSPAPVATTRQFTLPLPAGEFKAYLFDCDGTVVDSHAAPLPRLATRARSLEL